MRKSAFFSILLGGIALFSGMAAADEVRTVPGDYTTIQAAINACNNGDIVLVAPGIYTGSGNRDLDFGGKAITITSINPDDPCVVAATVINCQGTSSEPHRGFYFHNAEGPNSVVDGLKITNGYQSDGGAILCGTGSSPTITHCTVNGNSSEGLGGGIMCYYSSPTINNSMISNNSSYSGTMNGGGGIACHSSSPRIYNCIISNNNALGDGWPAGGGIYCEWNSSPTITNCIIAKNSTYYGGGILCDGTRAVISNCTLFNNSALYQGGGVLALCNDYTKINNCILWDNTADFGPEIYVESGLMGGCPSQVTVSYSDVKSGQTGVYVAVDSTLYWGPGNIDTDPCLANANNGDYHLKSKAGRWNPNSESWVTDAVTSPCIDAGNPGCPLGDEPSDANNVRINMGAYGGTAEASKTPADWRSIADLTNDWVVDFNDLGVFVSYWLDTGECIPSDLNRNRTVDFVDYAIFAKQWLNAPAAEPGIEYEISPCGGWGMSATESEPLDQTRFTVTVEGRRIHFVDTMVANCCAKELWLEMMVEDNLITVYENEEGGYCLCICNYPVTATLGPFEPGTYTLKVYNSSFIGSTTVIIE